MGHGAAAGAEKVGAAAEYDPGPGGVLRLRHGLVHGGLCQERGGRGPAGGAGLVRVPISAPGRCEAGAGLAAVRRTPPPCQVSGSSCGPTTACAWPILSARDTAAALPPTWAGCWPR